ncbi:hypothetical protein [Armatimonas rosea]|uniref:Putative membrane protein n=1 Tax=Armatimonas rosea TaxID=685828 RepID=A0A7W9SLH3_ARMRO|nr:hypothetical protein [Armatimonas rosea]MBB6048505.1 putative membrane protein [Armatimonas rosea]
MRTLPTALGIAASVMLWKTWEHHITQERSGTLTMLPPYSGRFPDSWALAISDQGGIAGIAFKPDRSDNIPIYWENPSAPPRSLPHPQGADTARLRALSHDGRFLVGQSERFRDTGTHATLWHPQGVTVLPSLTGARFSVATGVNTAGVAVGYVDFGDEEPRASYRYRGYRAVLWKDGLVEFLDEEERGIAAAINDSGLIAGYSTGQPVVWQKARKYLLKGGPGQAKALSLAGVIGGVLAGKPTIWSQLRATPKLLATPERVPGEVRAVNDRGQAVGVVFDPKAKAPRGAYWEDGTFRDPNTLIPAGSNFRELFPQELNSRGQLVGVGYTNRDELRGFIYTP